MHVFKDTYLVNKSDPTDFTKLLPTLAWQKKFIELLLGVSLHLGLQIMLNLMGVYQVGFLFSTPNIG